MSFSALRGSRVGPAPRAAGLASSCAPARGPPAARAWFGDFADAAAAATGSVPTVVAGLGALTAVGVGLLVTDPERR
jgi:hypothetical protein